MNLNDRIIKKLNKNNLTERIILDELIRVANRCLCKSEFFLKKLNFKDVENFCIKNDFELKVVDDNYCQISFDNSKSKLGKELRKLTVEWYNHSYSMNKVFKMIEHQFIKSNTLDIKINLTNLYDNNTFFSVFTDCDYIQISTDAMNFVIKKLKEEDFIVEKLDEHNIKVTLNN